MKLRLMMAATFIVLAIGAFAQKATKGYLSDKKGQLLGVHFSLSDFETPKTFKTSPTAIVRSERLFAAPKDMSAGFAMSYWKGLTSKIDFSGKINGVFYDYALRNQGTTGKTEIGLEIEPTINIRPIKDNNRWAPFLTAGIGGGIYTSRVGAYVPVGGGLQLNWNSTTYLFTQMQYHFALTKKVLQDNLYYSIGFAESFGPEKAPVVTPPPPPPVMEVPKDRDGDGVLDVDDKCPDVKGLASLKGCPDRDGDGIADDDDNCPDVKGTIKYKGCPVPDTDNDGINDDNDECPTVPGIARFKGCPPPDRDKDGVFDADDKCPDLAGPASNNGCPEIAKAVTEKVTVAAKNVFFATGSSKLLAKSNIALNNVVKILADDPTLILDVDGYTDNVGTDERNKVLSEDRANSVKNYLKSKGVSESRINVTGHGEEDPVADNKTAAGRAQNRRVEMKVRNY